MTLSKFLSRLINRKSNDTDDEQAQLGNLSKHEQAKWYVKRLATRKGRAFNPIKASLESFQTIDKNVEQLTLRLMQYTETIESGNSLTQQSCFTDFNTVTLDEFFTDSDGMYIPLATFNVFIESCEKLFAVLDQRSTTNDRDAAYAVRLLTKSFVSMQNICKAVEQVGQ